MLIARARQRGGAALRRQFARPARLVNQAIGRALRPRIVFLGDSITQFWLDHDPAFFMARRLNKGVSGNTTALMVERFHRDVVAWRPAAVHIMGGTNDLWYGAPGRDAETLLANLRRMADLAQMAGIRVILAAPPPITPAAATLFAHAALLPGLPDAIRSLCDDREGLHYVDYAPSLVDGSGTLRAEFTTDGVHLTRVGYLRMRQQAEAVLSLVTLPGA